MVHAAGLHMLCELFPGVWMMSRHGIIIREQLVNTILTGCDGHLLPDIG